MKSIMREVSNRQCIFPFDDMDMPTGSLGINWKAAPCLQAAHSRIQLDGFGNPQKSSRPRQVTGSDRLVCERKGRQGTL